MDDTTGLAILFLCLAFIPGIVHLIIEIYIKYKDKKD